MQEDLPVAGGDRQGRFDRGDLLRHRRSGPRQAGRIRGEYARFNQSFVGDATGKNRYDEALQKGLQTKKYALPPGVQPGGHGGSHGYLGDDFIDAILRGRKPAVDVVAALSMTVPGYCAHLSAQRGGETLKVPQYSP